MAEIRLDVRLTRPGALVAGVADGRVVLVRVLRDVAAGEPWVAARAAGLPVPTLEQARCGGRPALVFGPVDGAALTADTPAAVRGQARELGQALARHGIAAGQLRAGDLCVADGALLVRAPVEGTVGDLDAEAAALAGTVDEACGRGEQTARRRPGRAHAVLVAACVALAVMFGLAHGPGSPARAPRTPAAQAALLPPPVPAQPAPASARAVTPPKAARRPPRAHHHRPRRRHRPARRRPRRHPAAPIASRPHPQPRPPVRSRHGSDGAIPPAGGSAEPLPVL